MIEDCEKLFCYTDNWDILLASIFFIVRALFDVYYSIEKITKRGEEWRLRTFFKKNVFRYVLSLFTAVGLMLSLPELIHWIFSMTTDINFSWNIAFSASIGYAPIELFLIVKRKLKKKAEEYEDGL